MHDVVRDVALSIAKRENDFNVITCDGMNEPENDIGLLSKAISILFLKPYLKIPDGIEFRDSKLELLRCEPCDYSRVFLSNIKISWNLFEGASDLKVIDIVGGVISDFSYSISFPYLTKLKMLSLEELNLYSLCNTSFIQHLSCLETLSLKGSKIQVLPNEVGELKNLKVLDLTRCKCFINNNVLSRLTNLQELYMWDSFKDWKELNVSNLNEDVLSTTGWDNNVAELIELNCLNKLWRLELMVNNIEQVPRDVILFSSSRLLRQFKIRIGDGKRYWDKSDFGSGESQLWLDNVEDNINIFHAIGALIENEITNLYLCNTPRTWGKMDLNKFLSSLKDIVLKKCGSDITNFFTSPPSFLQISQIEETNEFGRYLRRIEIYECNQMRYWCSISILLHLKNLQILVLAKCEMLEEVVNTSTNTEKPWIIEFNALETLNLCDLDRLKYFCKDVKEIHFLRLRRLTLKGLEQFIFPSKIEVPHLKELEIISIPNITTLCNIRSSSLQKLKIVSCDNFKYIFSTGFIMNISHLESLIIRKCKMLKGVIGVSIEGAEKQWRKSIEFPKLLTLELDSLYNLTSFVIHVKDLDNEEEKEVDGKKKRQNSLFNCDDEVLFPCLDQLRTFGLSKINHIVGHKIRLEGRHYRDNDKDNQETISLSLFPMLKWLELYSLSNLIHVYESNLPKLGVHLFQNVKYLFINDCGQVKNLFTKDGVVKKLEFLCITNCPMMEVVMNNEAEMDEDDDDNAPERGGEGIISVPKTYFFPLLQHLRLAYMPCLRCFGDVGNTWSLPSLTYLDMLECPKLEALSPGYLDSPKLKYICYNDRKTKVENWNGDINTTLRDLLIRNQKEEFKIVDEDDRSGDEKWRI